MVIFFCYLLEILVRCFNMLIFRLFDLVFIFCNNGYVSFVYLFVTLVFIIWEVYVLN